MVQMELAAVARATDPETSHEAARNVENIKGTQQLIINLLRMFGPMTDDRIWDYAQDSTVLVSPSGLRTRRHELVTLGLVEDSGERATLSTGRRSIIWRAT